MLARLLERYQGRRYRRARVKHRNAHRAEVDAALAEWQALRP